MEGREGRMKVWSLLAGLWMKVVEDGFVLIEGL